MSERHPQDSFVDMRCSVAIVHNDEFLLVHRTDTDVWVLPGGTPQQGETMVACARREAREETGLDVNPTRCAFVIDVIDTRNERRVELVFVGTTHNGREPTEGEPGAVPRWVPLAELPKLRMRPPLAGYLPALARGDRRTAAYLGNLWRAEREHGRAPADGDPDRLDAPPE